MAEKLGVQTRGRYSRNNSEPGFFANGNNGSTLGAATGFQNRSLPDDYEDQYE